MPNSSTYARSNHTRPASIIKIICPLADGRVLVEVAPAWPHLGGAFSATQLRNVPQSIVPDGHWVNWRLARINDERVRRTLTR